MPVDTERVLEEEAKLLTEDSPLKHRIYEVLEFSRKLSLSRHFSVKDYIHIRNLRIGSRCLALPTAKKGVWSLFTVSDSRRYYLTMKDEDAEWKLVRLDQLEKKISLGKVRIICDIQSFFIF